MLAEKSCLDSDNEVDSDNSPGKPAGISKDIPAGLPGEIQKGGQLLIIQKQASAG